MEEEANFKIVESEAVKRQLVTIMTEAEGLGILDSVVDGVHRITSALRMSPRHFGDPRFRLYHAKLEVRTGMVGPIAVRFAIHDDLPVVFVSGYVLMKPVKP